MNNSQRQVVIQIAESAMMSSHAQCISSAPAPQSRSVGLGRTAAVARRPPLTGGGVPSTTAPTADAPPPAAAAHTQLCQ